MARTTLAIAVPPDRGSGPRLVTSEPRDAAQARATIEARAELDAAQAHYDALAKPLLARMMASGTDRIIVPGCGEVATTAASSSEQVDAKAAADALRSAGLTVPMKVICRRESLRIKVNA